MKKLLTKKTLWHSLFSMLALGIFILLANGSLLLDLSFDTTEYLGDGVYEASREFSWRERETVTGPVDVWDRWDGPVTRVTTYNNPYEGAYFESTEEVTHVHGRREGKAVTTFRDIGGNITRVETECYKKGDPVPCGKSAQDSEIEASSFQILSNSYPWYLYTLNAFNYDDSYVKAYLDTMDAIIGKHQLGVDSVFFDFYDEAISIIEETPYDSMLVINSILTLVLGLEELKNHEFRRAVIERNRMDGVGTNDVVENTYTPYLDFLKESGISVEDFNSFCHVLDSIMDSYGPLDMDHPFFIDSVENRMSVAISEIMDLETSSDSVKKSAHLFRDRLTITNSLKDYHFLISPISSTDSAVAGTILFSMYAMLLEGDIILKVTERAYMQNNNVPRLPRVTTELSSNNSPTSVTLNGYIVEDGGTEVTTRGIAWATYYNPTIDDNLAVSGTGIGSFSVTLDGLTEGMTYYARTYATNSVGTSYGNCIEFTATSTSGITIDEFDHDFKIYPNPANAMAKFSFKLKSSESMALTITNLKGQITYQHDLGPLPQGANRVELNLSELQSGIYNCQLVANGNAKATRKLVILR